jgi:hypothetical protein
VGPLPHPDIPGEVGDLFDRRGVEVTEVAVPGSLGCVVDLDPMSQLHPSPHSPDILSELLEPVGEIMPVEFAQKLAAMRAAPDVQARIDDLADRCNEGQLTEEERAEYEAYVDAIDVISILQARARSVPARQPNS